MLRTTCAAFIVSVFALLAASAPALAQDYPSRPLRLIVPNSPGTQVDAVSRIVSVEMQKLLGQPIVVENRAGANGVVAYEYVVVQTPSDGYTLVAVSPTSFTALTVTTKDLRFDPIKDLPPVNGMVEGRSILVTGANAPWKTFPELIAYAKANPGKMNYGEGSFSGRVIAEALTRANGVTFTGITYKTSAQMFQALATGEVHLATAAIGFTEGLRVLAVSGERRVPIYPNVPTFGELGFPEIPGAGVYLHVRNGTPKPIIDKLYAAAAKALESPTIRAQLTKLELEVMSDSPEITARKLTQASNFYSGMAKKLGL